MDTTLTDKQHRALDRLGASDPQARAVGWLAYRESFMPLVEAPTLDAVLAVEGRGAMRDPVRYFLSDHAVRSNLGLVRTPRGYVLGRKGVLS